MPPKVRGDYGRVTQVLRSLVKNSYHYTPENGKITIKLSAYDSKVQLDVVDTGIGIHPKNHHRVFDRFYRGEDPLVIATAGTGLGLAIARTIIKMHGGELWFRSSGVRGEGSTFSFTLPTYKEEE